MTRRRLALVVAVLLAIGGTIAFFLGGEEKAKPPVAETPARQDAPKVEPGPPAAPPIEVAQPIVISPAVVTEIDGSTAGELAGRVLNWGDNSPVAGAEVTIEGDAGAASFVTDAQGRFVAKPAKPGKHRVVSAFAEGFLPWAPDADVSPIELWSRPDRRVDGVVLYLVPAITYHGTVVDPDGKPVAGATVTMLDAAVGERAAAPIEDPFTSGADGKFDFHAPDDALFEARAAGFAPGRARLTGAVAVSREMTITLGARGGEAPAPLTIRGHVVDRRGDAVSGARVAGQPGTELGVGRETISDADGAFTLAGLDAGKHSIGVRAEGYAAAAVAAEAGATDLVVTLDDGARIVGRVITPSRSPVPAPTIVVQQRQGLVAQTMALVSVFDAQGEFVIDGLPAGTYEVIAQAAGYAPSEPSTAVAERDPDDVIITLRTGATLVGTLIDGATRAPLENGKITVEGVVGADGSSAVPIITTAITRADGGFELAGIAPGRRSMTAGAYGHHMAIIGPYDLVDGARVGPVTVELTPLAPGEEPKIELAGIGAALKAEGDVLLVQTVFPGGGADQAGLTTGDHVLAVDGVPVTNLGLDGAIQRIRGPVGSVVTLRVQRGDAAAHDLAVTRTKIRA